MEDFLIQVGNSSLVRVDKFMCLGVVLDPTLSWKGHVNFIGKKISFRLGMYKESKVIPKYTCPVANGSFRNYTHPDQDNRQSTAMKIEP